MKVGCLKQQISNSMARSSKGKYFTAPIRLYGIKLKKKNPNLLLLNTLMASLVTS